MKEHIDTIPLHEAFDSGDECPFCYLERLSEQRAIRYCIGPGASYMEPELREETDRLGFCRQHMKKLYDYGNALGNALILQTYLAGVLKELERVECAPGPKKSLFGSKPKAEEMLSWLEEKESTCFLCRRQEYNMRRYYHTFFVLLREEEFRQKVERSKGFCLHHFRILLEESGKSLPGSQRDWFREKIPALMQENLLRIKEDLDWFVMKNDFRNAGKEWKNARDAVPRGIQKLQGGHPADPVFRSADYGIKSPGK